MAATTCNSETISRENDILQQAERILETRIALPVETTVPFRLKSGSVYAPKSIEALKAYLALTMSSFETEHFHALYFEPSGKLIKGVETGMGTEKNVDSNPREILRQGLLCNASYAVVAHNHPNWDKRPSKEDQQCMTTLAKILDLVGIQLLYGFVVGGPRIEDIVPIEKPRNDDPMDLLRELFGEDFGH